MKELGQIGGRDVASTTKTVFKKLVGDEVAVFYNRTGRNGKQEAGKLKIFSLIYGKSNVFVSLSTLWRVMCLHAPVFFFFLLLSITLQ